MPNEKTLIEKKRIVEELTEKLKSQGGVFVNYTGITVNEDTEMRVKMREAGVDYTVIKNTLMRFAINNVGFEALDPILNGPTSLAVHRDDPIAPARMIKEYADKFADYFEIKGGFMDGSVLSAGEVNALAAIPPLPILQARLLGTMLAPITSLAVVLKAIAENGAAPVDANLAEVPTEPAAETSEEPAPAEAAAPEEPAPVEAVAPEAPASAEAAAPEDPAPVEAAAEEAEEAAAEEPAEKSATKKSPAKPKAKTDAQESAPAETTDE